MAVQIENPSGLSSTKKLLIVLALTFFGGLYLATERDKPTAGPAAAVSPQDIALAKAKNRAVALCEDEVVKAATNRSSVKFLEVSDGVRVYQNGAGQMIARVRFSARNSFGSRSITAAKCVISDDGQTLLDMTTQDSR